MKMDSTGQGNPGAAPLIPPWGRLSRSPLCRAGIYPFLNRMRADEATLRSLSPPPDGLAEARPGLFRQTMTKIPAVDTAAKLQRAKERLYVICQLGSWSVFFAIQLMYVLTYAPKSEYTPLEVTSTVARIILAGLLVTHYSRALLTRWGWKELGWRALWPRMLAAGVVMGLVWTAGCFFVDLVVLGYPWHRPYPFWQGFLVVWIQGSVSMIGWLCVYFFYHVLARLQHLQVEQLRLAASAKESELRALKSQVNPHFLFNSLNSLRALIDEDAPRAREAVTRLANMLRYSLQSGQLETVPFEDELRIVEDYLALEQIRHENRLRVRWDIAADARPLNVPPMLLQTLVENAVKYGIGPRREGGELVITARFDGAALNIRVTNPGDFTEHASPSAARAGSSTGVGLRNASERLRLLFGELATLTLLAEPPGCITADVLIPLRPSAR